MKIEVAIIKQLKDNYTYVIYSKENKEALIVDPSEPKPIFNFLNSQNLSLKGILITHHHSDHTQGITEIKQKYNVNVYTPNNKILGTIKPDYTFLMYLKISKLNSRIRTKKKLNRYDKFCKNFYSFASF